MIAIKGALTKEGNEIGHWHIWHIGDPVPGMIKTVVFQLDGEELQLLREAMEKTVVKENDDS